MSALLARIRANLAPTYIVEREIAHGGMSVVFLARDATLDRSVAIKVIRPELATARALERFEREARILANLNHPGIVPVFAAGDADGLFYFVMPFIEGSTLADRMAQGKLPPREAVRVAREILDALAAAHRVGVIHRDVSAANVFLVDGKALLADFGIAALPESAAQADEVSGTVGAMSPEQSTGAEANAATDTYAVALLLYQMLTGKRWQMTAAPLPDVWTGVPRRVANVLRNALAWAPEKRYADAGRFRSDLLSATRARKQIAVVAALALTAIALAAYFAATSRTIALDTTSVLAVLPFEVEGPDGTTVGRDLALLTALTLEGVPDLQITPPRFAFRWYDDARAQKQPPHYERLNAKYYTRGTVVERGDQLLLELSILNRDGSTLASFPVHGSAKDLRALGDSISLEIVRRVHPRFANAVGATSPVSTRNVAALREFLVGEAAFHRGAWLTADKHYRAAAALDPTFLLASWRLLSVWRWLPTIVGDPQLDIASLYRRYGANLSDLDRRLIEAQLAPAGIERIRELEEAVHLYPRDGYAALLYGDELLHRGPFAGIPTTRALAALERAAAVNDYLAPAHEHIAWAAIRLGDRAVARRALDRLSQLAAPPHEVDVYMPMMLEQAFVARFDPANAERFHRNLFDSTALGLRALQLAARVGMALGIPQTQGLLGSWLVNARGATMLDRANGHQAQALAAMMMARGEEALAHFDSAAILFDASAAVLEAAQWRVLPAALGWTAVPKHEQDAGRRALARYATDPLLASRALWTLAVDAFARGDTNAGNAFTQQLRSGTDSTALRLHVIAEALAAAANGDARSALRISQPLLSYDAHGAAGDPFGRAVLHLLRARWHAEAGDANAANAALVWSENQDLVGWPHGSAQATEVDWAFHGFALMRRANLAHAAKDTRVACMHLGNLAELWTNAEKPSRDMLAAAQRDYGCAS